MGEQEDIVVSDNGDQLDLVSLGTSDQGDLSYSEISAMTIEEIDIYQPVFIGFSVVGTACLMCYGMIVIVHLFRHVV